MNLRKFTAILLCMLMIVSILPAGVSAATYEDTCIVALNDEETITGYGFAADPDIKKEGKRPLFL